MRDDKSLVEAAVKILVLFFIMYLLASTWYFTFLQYRNGSSSTNTPDDMSLAGLEQLSFNDTSTNSQLRDPGFWSTALAESGRTTTYLVHDTIFGLMQSSKQWNDLFSENMDNPRRKGITMCGQRRKSC